MATRLTVRIVFAIALFSVSGFAGGLFAEEPPGKSQPDVNQLMAAAAESYAQGKYAEAIAHYRQAADSGNAWGQNNLAWIYATVKQPELRDGAKAVAYALKATAQEPQNAAFCRTLAAAHARAGQFEKAIAAQEKFLALLAADQTLAAELKQQLRADHQAKLALYRKQQAYVDDKEREGTDAQ